MTSSLCNEIVLYAPNINTGGGFVLLKSLFENIESGTKMYAFLDERVQKILDFPPSVEVIWVKPTVYSRVRAEWLLQLISKKGMIIFCFHGLPPLFPNKGKVIVFLQNKLYFGNDNKVSFSRKTYFRLKIEQIVSKLFRKRVAKYIVQTQSMRRELLKWYESGGDLGTPNVQIFPFFEMASVNSKKESKVPKFDFVYVADGEAHKNHKILFEAWQILAFEGIRPSLAVTLSERDGALKKCVSEINIKHDLQIVDLGQLPHNRVIELYGSSRALIFPSKTESFGLPLVEATNAGIPIIASELDFVRDVCAPVETFDPNSAMSIVRSVKRFLGKAESTQRIYSTKDFWANLSEN